MALKFTGRRFHDDTLGTVTFPAWSTATRIPCRITDEALMVVFGAGGTHSALVEAFDKHRAAIEAAAAWKYEAHGDAVQIMVVSADFEVKTALAPKREGPKEGEILTRLAQFRRAFHKAPAAPLANAFLSSELGQDDGAGEVEADEQEEQMPDEPATLARVED